MKINLNVQIKGGPRTKVVVDAYGTAVNEKILKFKNGNLISDSAIALWIRVYLAEMLIDLQEGGGQGD